MAEPEAIPESSANGGACDIQEAYPKIKSKSEAVEIVRGILENNGIPYRISGGMIIIETVKPCRICQHICVHSDAAIVLTYRKLDRTPPFDFLNDINARSEAGTYFVEGNSIVYRNYAYMDGQIEEKLYMILADGKRKSIEYCFEKDVGGPVYG